jgi:hypothetical protein
LCQGGNSMNAITQAGTGGTGPLTLAKMTPLTGRTAGREAAS